MAKQLARVIGIPRCTLRYERSGNVLTTILKVPAAPGVELLFVARVDLARVRALTGTAGHVGGFWDDLKHVVTAPIKVVKKLAQNPIVDAAFPVLAINFNKHLVPIRDAVVSKLPIPGAAALGKLAGASKVLKLAHASMAHPVVRTMLPSAAHIAPALAAANATLVAMELARRGDPRARNALIYAARKAQAGDAAQQTGNRMAAKVYRLAVLPT